MRVPWVRSVSFSRQFLLFGLAVLVVGMITIGVWVQHEIRQVFIARTAETTALFVDSFMAHHLQDLEHGDQLDAASVAALDDHLLGTSLGSDFVIVKLWTESGTVAYSTNPDLIGRSFRVSDSLLTAFAGETVSGISDLSDAEHALERELAESLIETYTPVRSAEDGTTIAVAEFYQRPDALLAAISAAQTRGWVIVIGATALMYMLLVGMARRASKLIRSQREELENNVEQLNDLLTINQQLHGRTREAAGRVTSLNERFLRQISADLHDGPAQNVALARMHVDALGSEGSTDNADLDRIGLALDGALTDIRSIARGLRAPEIDGLSPSETASSAVEAFERTTRTNVDVRLGNLPNTAPPSITATIYRVLQEALANSYKHASGAKRSVSLSVAAGDLVLDIDDDGPGFDPLSESRTDAFGLDGMRGRVEMLGGSFEIDSHRGTRISVRIPIDGAPHE